MTHLDTHTSRTLTATLAAAPLALLVLAAAFFPGSASALTPLALILPLLSMWALEGVLEHGPRERRSQPPRRALGHAFAAA